MTFLEIGPLFAAVIFLIVTIKVMLGDGRIKQGTWRVPALFFLLFTAFSIWTVVEDGMLGFWPNHSQDLWGNQVWYDLLFALALGWALIMPKAKAVGMRLPLWLLFICCSGSIGFSAMVARYFYLAEKLDPA